MARANSVPTTTKSTRARRPSARLIVDKAIEAHHDAVDVCNAAEKAAATAKDLLVLLLQERKGGESHGTR